MRILLFGANGKIGRIVTQQALERGHTVTGFVLRSDSKKQTDKNYREYIGDATNQQSVAEAMTDHDVVVSVLGHSRSTPTEMQSNAMRVITETMSHHNISRIVSLTGAGVFTAGDHPSLLDRFFVSLLLFLDPKRIQDGIKHVEVLKDSQLDWVVLRTPKHSNRKPNSQYTLKPHVQGARFSVPRIHIVACMLDLAEAEELTARMPVLDA